MLKETLFEDYLSEQHAKDYHGTDDVMTDAFVDWLSNLDNNDFIEYGNKFAQKLLASQKAEFIKLVEDHIDFLLDNYGDVMDVKLLRENVLDKIK